MNYSELVQQIRGNVEAAATYLRETWARFAGLDRNILDAQHRAAVAAYHAQQAGDVERADEAKQLIRDLAELKEKHDSALNAMAPLASFVGLTGYRGLGAIPAAQIAPVTALALLVAWGFYALSVYEHKLELLEAGTITPEQFSLLNPGPPPTLTALGALAKLGLAALVVYVGWQLVQQYGPRRRARRNPPLVVFNSNPPAGADIIGDETYAVWYQHAKDGAPYVHEFGSGVELLAEPDGSVRLEHREGLGLWADFEVDDDELELEEDEEELVDVDELEDELGGDDDDDELEEWDDDDDDDGGAW